MAEGFFRALNMPANISDNWVELEVPTISKSGSYRGSFCPTSKLFTLGGSSIIQHFSYNNDIVQNFPDVQARIGIYNNIKYAPNGQILAGVINGADGGLETMMLEENIPVFKTNITTNTCYDCAYSPNGLFLAAASYRSPFHDVYKVNPEDATQYTRITNSAGITGTRGTSVAWNPIYTQGTEQDLFVTCIGSPFIRRLNVTETSITGGNNPPAPSRASVGLSCCVSRDGKYLAVSFQPNEVGLCLYRINGTQAPTLVCQIQNLQASNSMCFNRNGTRLYVTVNNSEYGMYVFNVGNDTLTPLEIPTFTNLKSTNGVDISQDGDYIVIGMSVSPYIKLFKKS